MVENSFTSTKCECGNTIEINEIHYVAGENDSGWIKVQCNKCKNTMEEFCRNPDTASVVSGGLKISHRCKE
nr:hypothetical protein [uncultured Campylobacter sp.]